MLVLGCVAEVRDFELVVALPNGLRGSVAITDISDAYTSLLQQLASGDSGAADDVSEYCLSDSLEFTCDFCLSDMVNGIRRILKPLYVFYLRVRLTSLTLRNLACLSNFHGYLYSLTLLRQSLL